MKISFEVKKPFLEYVFCKIFGLFGYFVKQFSLFLWKIYMVLKFFFLWSFRYLYNFKGKKCLKKIYFFQDFFFVDFIV